MLSSLVNHEPWSDEIHAWGLAINSSGPAEIFRNLAYDGHPGLWHLLLWCASWISLDLWVLKVVHGAIGLGIISLIGLRFPASPIERAVLLLNYFVIFEFSVISRNYAVGFLLFLLYSLEYRKLNRALLPWVILGFAANANVYALILSGVLATERAVRSVFILRHHPSAMAPGLLAYLALLVLSVATLAPAPDIAFTVDRRFLTIESILDFDHAWRAFLRFTVTPFVPVTLGFPDGFASAGRYWSVAQMVGATCLVFFVLPTIAFIFRRDPLRLLIVFATMASAGLFAHLFYLGSVRHCGVVLIAFAVALWLSRSGPEYNRQAARVQAAVLVLLLGGAIGGLEATAAGWMRTFSTVGPAARWIKENDTVGTPLIGFWDMQASSVAITLNRPIYLVQCGCWRSYAHLDNRRDRFDLDTMPVIETVEGLRKMKNSSAILVSGLKLTSAAVAHFERERVLVQPLANFGDAERDRELFLYRLQEMKGVTSIGR